MANKHELPNRQSIRLKKYDYSLPGYYYVTICTQDRICLFGDIVGAQMILNDVGEIVNDVWQTLPDHHPVQLDICQIMPNHLHFVLILLPPRRGIARNAPTFGNVTTGSLPNVIRSFKSACTKQIRRSVGNPAMRVWQRNYHESIIRNEKSLQNIQKYIKHNPEDWGNDENNILQKQS